jgi:outer membrane lipoprotein-sorting protein
VKGKFMKCVLLVVAVALTAAAFAAQNGAVPAKGAPATSAKQSVMVAQATGLSFAQSNAASNGGALEKVLSQMDATAAKFSSAQADLETDNYSKVVDDHDIQKGTFFVRKTGKGVEMALDITEPEKKYVLFNEGTVQVFEPKIDQVTKYNAGKNRAAMESFLVLGFGGKGHDLPKQFDVKYAGTENVGGVNAAKLELVPRQASVKNMYSLITLWIDPARGVSVQQKFLDEKSGDYRLAKYSNIKMNEKIPDSVFRLKTTSKTRFVSPQG